MKPINLGPKTRLIFKLTLFLFFITFSLAFAGNTTSTYKDASWLLKVLWTGTGWTVYSRALRYIFESVNQNRFYFNNTSKIFDPNTNTLIISFLKYIETVSRLYAHIYVYI